MNPRFSNPWPHAPQALLDVIRWKLRLGSKEKARIATAPNTPAPWVRLDPASIAVPPADTWRAVWLGHASFLLQGCGLSLLIDPVFSSHCGPFPLPMLRRKIPPPCAPNELPLIDAVLLTHSHYDHLDLPTLRRLGTETRLLVPAGHGPWLRTKGFQYVDEVRWHETVELADGVHATATPAQHFTARSLIDRNLAHWCGWRVDSPHGSLWHAGDSGYCRAFREIGERHGPVDYGMIPIGAYQPRQIMRSVHMNPDEAVATFLDTGCRRATGMHWGTFQLTDEPLGEPPILLDRALLEKNIPPAAFLAGTVGERIEIKSQPLI